MPWNWDCKLWANWNASSHPAEMLRLPIGQFRLVEMGGAGEKARSGRSVAKGRGGQLGTAELEAFADWRLFISRRSLIQAQHEPI